MLVLGWHGNPRTIETDDTEAFAYHDAAAALVEDGLVIAAVEEERLNRVKHSNVFPTRSIRYCLHEAGATLRDVDGIVTDIAEEFYDYVALRDASFNPRLPMQSGRQMLASAFEREFQIDVSDKIRFCRHHTAHLCSAFLPSGFSEALVVTIDGHGDGFSGLVAHCTGENTRILRHIPESQSLGGFYLHNMFFLGYHRFDEYKAMGLAPYGDPAVYDALIKRMYVLQSEGRYNLLPLHQCFLLMKDSGMVMHSRRKGAPFTQKHKDFAAALQVNLERIVEHVVMHFQAVTRAKNLCLSGGVAHNCSMNGKLLRSGRFRDIYVQPAAHDAGNTIGSALAATRDMGKTLHRKPLPHLFLGPDIGSCDEIGRRLDEWRPLIEFELSDDVTQRAAELIAGGSVIGWVQGRSEFGPRALGNRSILADPRPADNQKIINAMVKKRESFRPFAPAVIEEKLHEYFEVPEEVHSLPFMVMVAPVRPAARKLLAAVTHVDGTARVQSVSKEDNSRFHALIEAFGRVTGTPVLLNTSFNNNAEPIVDSIDDSVTCFLTTGLHGLVIGDWFVQASRKTSLEDGVLGLIPTLSTSHKVVSRRERNGEVWCGIESHSMNQLSAQMGIPISSMLFSVLTMNANLSFSSHLARAGITEADDRKRYTAELIELWSARCIQLHPLSTSIIH